MKWFFLEVWIPGPGKNARAQHRNRSIRGQYFIRAFSLATARRALAALCPLLSPTSSVTARPVLPQDDWLFDNPLVDMPQITLNALPPAP